MRTPNVLFICSDEHQARALGCAGSAFVSTPNLDALAAKGTRFSDAVTPAPICVPARASLATGRHVHQTRCWDNAMPYDGSIPSWGHALQAKGIPVEAVGKLHYRSEDDPNGFDRVHDAMMVLGGTGMLWASIRAEDERLIAPNRMLGDYIGPGDSKYIDYDARVTARTQAWLRDHASDTQPWCLYVGLVAPHFPLVAPPAFYELYPPEIHPRPKLHPQHGYARHPWIERQDAVTATEDKFHEPAEREAAVAAYYGLVSWLDHNVGQILTTLEQLGLRDETLVIYTSDHGDNVGARGLWGKSNFYHEAVSVPLILAGPGVGQGICETPVSLIDIPATIADTFEAPFRGAPGSRALTAIAKAPFDPDRVVFSEYHATGAVSGGFMVKTARWKYLHYVGFEPELFDLWNDPEEIRDLAQDPGFAAVRARMLGALLAICDPAEVSAAAFADQAAMIEKIGGKEVAFTKGARGATPPPGG